jgi:unsaturated chondroitin disaccharide hydrolase
VPVRILTLLAAIVAFAMPATPASAATRLPSDTVVSATLRATGPDAAVLAAGRRVPVRRGAAVRLEAVRSGSRLEVALGTRRWRGPAQGGIRTRGPLRVRRVLATGDDPAELIAHRLLAVEPVLRGDWQPDGAAPSGRIRRTRDWKRGFYAGSLWRAIEAAPHVGDALEPVAWRATRALWGGESDDIHDVGFIFGEADHGALRVACRQASSADCRHAARSLRRAAGTLHRLAAATPAGAIVVTPKLGCKACTGDELKVFIDSVMNMTPLLEGTEADRALAEQHLEFVRRELVRADGSTTQQLFLRRSTGAITRKLGHDPIPPESTWARGQAWAIRGYAEAAQAIGGPWVDVAERTADWIASRPGGVPGWDWNVARRAQDNPGDTSAAAISAAGLARVLELRCRPAALAATAERCAAWSAARDRLLATALRGVSTRPGTLGRFSGQRYLWDPSRRIDYRGEYFMGTVYLLEALAISSGSSLAATTASTAAGASGASAAAAFSG